MTLPTFRSIGADNKEVLALQDSLRKVFDILLPKEIIDGVLLENVPLLNGAINHIEHGLGRAAKGYIPVKRSISSNIAIAGTKIWLSATPPAGWLICDGSAINRITYASLFAKIGTTYGAGDGVTTFNIPDFRQKFPIGKSAAGTGSTLGGTGGAIDHTHSVPAHYHGMGAGADLNIVSSGSHQHGSSVAGNNFGLTASTAFTTPGPGQPAIQNTTANTATANHTHNAGDFAGRIGLFTGGVDGNAAMSSGLQNPPFLSVNFIIQVDNFEVNSSVWDGEDANVLKDVYLDLYTAANMTVSLWVF